MKNGRKAIHFTIFEEFFPKRPTKSDRRKIQIIETAITELATRGVAATNHESLAKACGISRALVQHYFPDREELILIAMRFVRAKYQKLCVDAIAEKSTPQDRLKAYLEAACSWPKVTPQDAKLWLLFYYNCSIAKKYRKLNTEFVSQGEERITALLKEISSRNATPPTSPLMKAKMIQALILSYFVNTLTEDQSRNFNDELLASTFELCYHVAGVRK